MTAWIQNVSLSDISQGRHLNPGPRSMLIQIVDPCMQFPSPAHQFGEVHQFEFLDLEADDPYEFKITDEQAQQLVTLLKHALEQDMNVVVHCVLGVCRSGAVCEVGVMMGFADTRAYRQPNLLVKHRMMQALGWHYE